MQTVLYYPVFRTCFYCDLIQVVQADTPADCVEWWMNGVRLFVSERRYRVLSCCCVSVTILGSARVHAVQSFLFTKYYYWFLDGSGEKRRVSVKKKVRKWPTLICIVILESISGSSVIPLPNFREKCTLQCFFSLPFPVFISFQIHLHLNS